LTSALSHNYTLSLHDALPIFAAVGVVGYTLGSSKISGPTVGTPNTFLFGFFGGSIPIPTGGVTITQSGGSTDVTEGGATDTYTRSEEHTSELQSRSDLVCRLL